MVHKSSAFCEVRGIVEYSSKLVFFFYSDLKSLDLKEYVMELMLHLSTTHENTDSLLQITRQKVLCIIMRFTENNISISHFKLALRICDPLICFFFNTCHLK